MISYACEVTVKSGASTVDCCTERDVIQNSSSHVLESTAYNHYNLEQMSHLMYPKVDILLNPVGAKVKQCQPATAMITIC